MAVLDPLCHGSRNHDRGPRYQGISGVFGFSVKKRSSIQDYKQPQSALLDFAQSEWGQGWRTPYSV